MAASRVSFPAKCEKVCDAFLSTRATQLEETKYRAVYANLVEAALSGNKPSADGYMDTLEREISEGYGVAGFYRGIIDELMTAAFLERKKARKAQKASMPAPAPVPAPVQAPTQQLIPVEVLMQCMQLQMQQQQQCAPVHSPTGPAAPQFYGLPARR